MHLSSPSRPLRPVLGPVLALTVLLLVVTLTAVSAPEPATAGPARAAVSPTWTLVAKDDFVSFDSSRWTKFDGAAGCCPDNRWSPAMVNVSGGMLHLQNKPDASGNWTSGGVGAWAWPAATRTYGRYDVRVRFAPGAGVSAVGLLWPMAPNWPPEIDFYEIGAEYATRQTMYVTNHWPDWSPGHNGEHAYKQAFVNGDFTTWHTISTRWSWNSLKVYVDGVLRFNETDQYKIPDEKMWLGFQTHAERVNGTLQRLPAGQTSVDLDIDWVRIYQES